MRIHEASLMFTEGDHCTSSPMTIAIIINDQHRYHDTPPATHEEHEHGHQREWRVLNSYRSSSSSNRSMPLFFTDLDNPSLHSDEIRSARGLTLQQRAPRNSHSPLEDLCYRSTTGAPPACVVDLIARPSPLIIVDHCWECPNEVRTSPLLFFSFA